MFDCRIVTFFIAITFDDRFGIDIEVKCSSQDHYGDCKPVPLELLERQLVQEVFSIRGSSSLAFTLLQAS